MKKEGRYRIDIGNRLDLADQLSDALRMDIEKGCYRPGDVLPTIRDLAKETGVSIRTVRRAIGRLSGEGYITPRPRIGSVVMPKNVSVWRGHVLIVYPDEDVTSYYVNTIVATVQDELLRERYHVSLVSVSRGRDADLSHLSFTIGQTVDFAIVIYNLPAVARTLERAHIPYLELDGRGSSARDRWKCIPGESAAIGRFVGHCVKAKIRTVWEVGGGCADCTSAASALTRAGIRVRHYDVAPIGRYGRLEGLKRAGLKFILDVRGGFPDLLFFCDDFVAQGALMALVGRGLRAPEDVRVVTVANAGLGPVYLRSLTRMEYHAETDGHALASFVLAALVRKRLRKVPVTGPTYVIGETFV